MVISPDTWNVCVTVLTSVGYKEVTARALIGKQLREWDEADVVAAYSKASGKVDPRSYAAGILAKTKKKERKLQDQLPLLSQEKPADPERAREAIRQGIAMLRGRFSSGGTAG